MDITIETEAPADDTVEAASLDAGIDVSSDGFETESEPVEPLFELDGEPITLDEARNGYLRQRDYTRKTQELAEQRRQLRNAEVLQAALNRDPQATLKALAEAYGVQTAGSKVADVSQDSVGWGDDETQAADPRVDDLLQWREQQEVAAAQAQIRNELAQLSSQYGEFDTSEVLRFAVDNGFPDVVSAFKAWRFDEVQSELSRRLEDQKRLQAKREAQVVSPQGSRTAAAVSAAPEGGLSIRDAWLAAKKEHGG